VCECVRFVRVCVRAMWLMREFVCACLNCVTILRFYVAVGEMPDSPLGSCCDLQQGTAILCAWKCWLNPLQVHLSVVM
jgi:hypothetical protein